MMHPQRFFDDYFMSEALHLARKGVGRTSPNPMVGAVLAKDNKLIGRGFHRCCGEAHAETIALIDAHGRTEGATLYTNLEPCIHHGRTPPCAEAIVRARLARVVVAMRDPNPAVAGRGIAFLRRHHVKVDLGLMKNQAEELNRAYIKCTKAHRPYVIVKIASSLDCRMAFPNGSGRRRYITSVDSRRMVHALRAQVGAVLVGVDTVLADNPRLTNRWAAGPSPTRIILDARLRTPLSAHVLRAGAPTIVVGGRTASKERAARLATRGASVIIAPTRNRKIMLRPLLKMLCRMGVTSLMVEGGARVFASFLEEKLFDELLLYVAPKIMGKGKKLGLHINRALRLSKPAVTTLGEDCLYKYVYGNN